ncbi:hypothetical protein [Nesterenkonia jeotgali]|uniref:Galactose mutarotase-like enzyme n=1 Tax=Nesterenkonia jeotgali TaxID=317018 RepID=A0A839FQT6_9MICC|nr:hypothetical protein [Nesterenkonia jeotgali]MBA8921919.1 galactose mutarotase-like enzyme [Nesterenkonia jeotgali]
MDTTNSVSITGGGYTAQISLLGGQLLNLSHLEDELIVPAAQTEGAFAGAVLAPWPNRTKGASYTYAGVEHLLPVNEEATGAALHGLLIDTPLRVVSQKESEVQLAGWLESSEGYPFGLEIALTYRVSADLGLAATLMARYQPEELADPSLEEDTDAAEPEGEATDPNDRGVDELDAGDADLETSDAAEPEADPADTDQNEAAQPEAEDSDNGDQGAAEEDATLEPELTASVGEDGETAPAEATVAGVDAHGSETDESETRLADLDPEEAASAHAAAPRTAPFGAGFHPYLTAGGAPLKECRLRLPARTMLKTKADGSVTGRKSVSADFDLTNGPLLAGRRIDHAFTDLPEEGWTAELVHGPSGFVVRMIADTPWVQVYTGERIDRAGVAVEPMTCPPNALNSGEDLIHLEPGTWFRVGYSIEAIRVD